MQRLPQAQWSRCGALLDPLATRSAGLALCRPMRSLPDPFIATDSANARGRAPDRARVAHRMRPPAV